MRRSTSLILANGGTRPAGKPVLPGGREQEIFVVPVQAGQSLEEVPEIGAHAGLPAKQKGRTSNPSRMYRLIYVRHP